uniref:Uncharacterized protein n=1 Tax=Oryza brachyantha TaxID=4533 RepID=J3M0R1_ORYBR
MVLPLVQPCTFHIPWSCSLPTNAELPSHQNASDCTAKNSGGYRKRDIYSMLNLFGHIINWSDGQLCFRGVTIISKSAGPNLLTKWSISGHNSI